MTDTRHRPYVMQEPLQGNDPNDLKQYLYEELRKIEQAQNGVDLDVETRWGLSTLRADTAQITLQLPSSYKHGSAIRPSVSVLFPVSATAGALIEYILTHRVLTHEQTAGAYVAQTATLTAQAGGILREVFFPEITATAAVFGSYFQASLTTNPLDYSSTTPEVIAYNLRYEMDSLGAIEWDNK